MRNFAFASLWLSVTVVAGGGCSDLGLDPAPTLIHARFDPDASVIPMPTDVLRDKEIGRLDLPNDTVAELAKLNAAEAEFYDYLETLDGWSSLMSATVEFTGALDAKSITDGTVQVWRWSAVPERVVDVRMTLSPDGTKLTLDPPRTGWLRGTPISSPFSAAAASRLSIPANCATSALLCSFAATTFISRQSPSRRTHHTG